MEGAHAVLPALVARDDDADDVRWALHTAQARWQVGGHADAIVWMRRAADAAEEAGDTNRASELREDADDLAEQVWFSDKGSGSSAPPQSTPMDIDVDAAELTDDETITSLDPNALISRGPASLDADELDSSLPQFEVSSEPDLLDGAELIDDLLEPPDEPTARGAESVGQPAPWANQGRRPLTSAPDLEVAEVEFDDEDLSAEDIETLLAPPRASDDPFSQPPISARRFDDRISSADVVPMSAEAAIPRIDSDPESLSFADLSGPPPGPADDVISAEDADELADLMSDEVEFEGEESNEIDEGFAELAEAEAASARPSASPESPSLAAPALAVSEGPALASSLPPAPPAANAAAVEPAVDGMLFEGARGLEDLPREVQFRLAQSATVEELQRGDEVGFFGAALITHGAVDILPAIADDAGAQARQGDVVFTAGTLSDNIALRVEAKIDGTRVAVWSPEEIASALESCPWVADELRFIADHFLALCGATLGPLGERLDNALRGTVFARMQVRACEPGRVVAEAGKALDGLYVVGGGRVEIMAGDAVEDELSPGDILFPSTMLSAGAAPAQARAGSGGALLLYASRSDARELMMSIPPLLEVLAY